ncbi:hypothetical protein F2Q69_00056982 [Brassica cretica]|uniref:RNase H type-1 domain-containing protein n=1 Tax=Brassica cretica TaxID=69181 RepID=A0A8S9N700_BRACR|nr:hypothetical protein F2Q69_00056982 [Brassica cretica]
MILEGQRCARRAQSPLHAEAEGITRGVASLAAELDEMKLWRSKFYNVALSFLPRSNNFCADSFAKEGRSRVQCFSFINSLVLFWPAPEARLNEPV